MLKWIAATPRLLTNVKPCRGDWAEARIRGCQGGLPATGIPVEPMNTFSNLAYLAAGWVTLRVVAEPPAWPFAATMAFLCVGSALYHGTKALWAARLDHSGMYAVFAALAYYAMAPENPAITYVMAVAAVGWGIGFAFLFRGDLNVRMALLLTLVSVRAMLMGTTIMALLSLGLMAVAMTVWMVDKKTSVLGRWGHGMWHAMTAAALAVMFTALTP